MTSHLIYVLLPGLMARKFPKSEKNSYLGQVISEVEILEVCLLKIVALRISMMRMSHRIGFHWIILLAKLYRETAIYFSACFIIIFGYISIACTFRPLTECPPKGMATADEPPPSIKWLESCHRRWFVSNVYLTRLQAVNRKNLLHEVKDLLVGMNREHPAIQLTHHPVILLISILISQ